MREEFEFWVAPKCRYVLRYSHYFRSGSYPVALSGEPHQKMQFHAIGIVRICTRRFSPFHPALFVIRLISLSSSELKKFDSFYNPSCSYFSSFHDASPRRSQQFV
jgi:hypothetical protein